MLIAVAAMASVSCQKEENAPVNETKSATLTLHATVTDTKTFIEENAVLWGTGEYVQLYFNDGTNSQYVKSNNTHADEWNGSDEAMFAFDIEYTEAESYVLGGVYPASAVTGNDTDTDPAAYKVDLPATQDATATSYDPAAFIMIMKPETVANSDFDKDGHIASFRRAAALNKITLKGLKETITSITITVPEDKYLAGRRYFDLTTGVEGEIYHAKSNSITVNGTYNAGDVNVWFTSWGVELAAGEELTIKMTSATKTYTRTIAVREEGIKFVEGGLNTLIVNMSSVDGVVLDNLAGEYLIVNADLTCAAQAWAGGNNLPQYDLTVEDGVILESTGLENCKMTIELQSNGKYTIKDAKNNYLYAPSTSSNHLKGLPEPSELTDWTIVKDGDKYVLTSSGNNSRNILRYNSSSAIFSCYSSGQGDVTLYKYSEIKPDTNPSITVEEGTEASIGAEGGNLTFTCTTKNLDGKTLEVVEESDNLTWAVAENVVTITVATNEAAESRTLNATIKCGSVEVPVTINQAGKPVEGGESTVATWSWAGGGKSDFTGGNIYETNGLGSDYAASHAPYQIKMDGTGDYFIIKVDGAIQSASVGVKMIGGASKSTLQVLGSSDGNSFTSVEELSISGSQNDILELVTTKQFDPSYRYLKFNFNKGSNIGVGPITITYIPENSEGGETPDPTPDPDPEEPGENITISVDFESDTYSEWTTTNMQLKQTGAITAKEGTYYGTTGGKESASIATKNTYASPKSITCYVSKQSNNTNALSNWKIEVSTDGNTWTEVKTQAAASMDKGTWVEFTADLSTYTNVYVRVSYAGSTAVRNIDALTFTYSE